jgi:electron transport complex protein RnfC
MPVEYESKTPIESAGWPDEPPELLKAALPDRLLVPIGMTGAGEAAAKSLGTQVRRGEKLVDHAAESSHVPLAPADGTLGNVRPIRLTTGRAATAVELIVSGDSDENSENSAPGDYDFDSLIKGLEHIRAAGVWADRHASPDLIGQLNRVMARPIDTLICTALDSDAGLRLNATVAARFSERVIAGVSLLARITGVRGAMVAVENFAGPEWIMPVRNAARGANVQIVELANDYPQSDPTLMIYSLTRRRLRPGNLPTVNAALVLDAAAALAIGNAAHGEAMLSVPVAVHDHANRHSHFLEVAVGTTVEQVLKQLSIPTEESVIRGGDLLRDVGLRLDAVIAGGELTIHVTSGEAVVVPEPCIRCAWCFEACPTLVHPAFILDAAQRRDLRMAHRAGIAACIECGVCAHVCPSRLPLLQAIREVRNSKFD